jgi:hypothetical protein
MEKVKIGKGYFQSGYGRGFNKYATIWLINGKAYARELESFVETSSDDNHKIYIK